MTQRWAGRRRRARRRGGRHQRLVARTVLGRAGTPDDVAGCVFFLASDDASYVTGQLLQRTAGRFFHTKSHDLQRAVPMEPSMELSGFERALRTSELAPSSP